MPTPPCTRHFATWAAMAALAVIPAYAQQLEQAAWLAGCWAAVGAEAGTQEQWMPLVGGSMLGMGRTVKNGKTVEHEFMQIRQDASGKVVFIAKPSGKDEGSFTLLPVADGVLVFENLVHDFPQRVIYRLQTDGQLAARLEGLRNGKLRAIDFPMQRVACEAPSRANP